MADNFPNMGMTEEQKRAMQILGYPAPVKADPFDPNNPRAVDAELNRQFEEQSMGEQLAPASSQLMDTMTKAPEQQSFLSKFLSGGRTIVPGQIQEESAEEEPKPPMTSTTAPATPTTPKSKPFQIQPSTLDVGTAETSIMDRLRAAQEKRSQGQTLGQLGKAAELIGTGISHAQPVATKLFDENIRQAGQPVQDLAEQIALEKKDPNSSYSKGLREYLKRFGINVAGDFTGELGEKMVPWALNQYENELHRHTQKEIAEENRVNRADLAKERAEDRHLRDEERKERERERADTKAAGELDKRFSQANKLINAEIASSRSSFGRGANIHRSAEAIERLVGNADLNNLDSRQIQELARNLDAMLTSGAATISGTKKLIPSTAAGDAMHIAEYITGLPKGAQQGDFVRRMIETVKREKDLAKDQMRRTQKKLLGGYTDLVDKDPDRFSSMLQLNDLPTDIIDLNAKPTEAQEASTGDEEKVIIINPKGQRVKIRKSQLSDAVRQGYKAAR